MNVQDYMISCTECGCKLGAVTLIGGTMNVFADPKACCLSCLPARLDKLEQEGYNPPTLKRFRDWINEEASE